MNRWRRHARAILGPRWIVFLPLARGTGTAEASTAANQRARSNGAEGTPVDPAGAIAECLAAASLLWDPLGTAADGTARLQPSVSLVRRACPRRSCVERDDLHQEPRTAAARRRVSEVHDEASAPLASEATLVGRTFLGRWNPDRSLGLAEEFSGQGWRRQRRGWREFSWPEALERDACEHNRS